MKRRIIKKEGVRQVVMSEREIAALEADRADVATKKAKTAWKRQRKAAYPPIGDAIDAFWHSLDVMKDSNPAAFIGQHQSTKEWYLTCRRVKQDNPKPAEA